MTTRYAKPGSPLSQNRFASSPKINDGLRGNLVAMRCTTIEAREDRELIWTIQSLSNREGGLKKFVADLIAEFPEHVATRALFDSGAKPGKKLNADLVRRIREGLPIELQYAFLLKGETDLPINKSSDEFLRAMCSSSRLEEQYEAEVDEALRVAVRGSFMSVDRSREEDAREEARAAARPNSYPADSFYQLCQKAAMESLEADLKHLCLDPDIIVGSFSLWYFHDIIGCLREFQKAQADRPFPHTAISRAIWRQIDEAHEMGGVYLLHNSSGNGKSFAATGYRDAHPGRACYFLAPPTNTEIDFWRGVAEAAGTADGLSYKCEQVRSRATPTLLNSGRVLVIDAAQNLFPVSDYRYALPKRMDQILQLAEKGLAVVMIADSKLFDILGFVEVRTGWNRNQFVNQLTRVLELPGALDQKEVELVAAQLMPDGDRAAQCLLAKCMIGSPRYLHAGKAASQRARRIAAGNQHPRVTLADMEAAVETSVSTDLEALESCLKRADDAKSKLRPQVRNWRPDTEAQTAAKGKRRRNQIVTSSDLKQQPQSRPASALQHSGNSIAGRQFHQPGDPRRAGTGSGRAVAPAELETV